MTWMGPTYGAWADTIAETDAIVARSNKKDEVIEEWRQYASKLQASLDEVRDLYEQKAGEAKGHAVLKELALEELRKFDPENKMLDKAHRQEVYDKVKAETIQWLRS